MAIIGHAIAGVTHIVSMHVGNATSCALDIKTPSGVEFSRGETQFRVFTSRERLYLEGKLLAVVIRIPCSHCRLILTHLSTDSSKQPVTCNLQGSFYNVPEFKYSWNKLEAKICELCSSWDLHSELAGPASEFCQNGPPSMLQSWPIQLGNSRNGWCWSWAKGW